MVKLFRETESQKKQGEKILKEFPTYSTFRKTLFGIHSFSLFILLIGSVMTAFESILNEDLIAFFLFSGMGLYGIFMPLEKAIYSESEFGKWFCRSWLVSLLLAWIFFRMFYF